MIGIVIVAHGGLAREYRAAIEHVIGPQQGIRDIAIEAECNRAAKRDEIRNAVEAVEQGEGVVIVTDMFGGSPSNLALEAARAPGRSILYGANLPMLVKLAKSRHRPVDQAVSAACAAGRKYLDSICVQSTDKERL